ncbi:MAG: adenosylmethionine--8-amino-7-oxononanoate transaminase [Candidatus Omnitrophica bacterium CG11_big_fil_rev_8_21_14_0_20_45_26]|uniref:Adenosylmethionine-8-amino-7-oxononanoate aminotransferase n=1 Tax=Candidatus Abzuiibacterium crystallinum TaxID=1974748 RepID=A0A2H0LPX0_9BACT|nr:MAG: adenosylmethionine--8-amino-7-oxononanoate transaminase [Candidatus Omnitrophica bacterium CG11_big_fil_rev_8_21_14_0_20_45_26]PIW63725.1 MAG: adenosylmethionine--8-amino-7-oxononanoate transaminase [Candidatus Omnitrophica bacterium CG12_big_fil_rev_8_21_14_0_65_45_16]
MRQSNKTKQLAKLDKEYIWHPFTQQQEWEAEDILIIESGSGNYLKDTDGKRYLDGVSSLWCNVHGHRVKDIDRAVEKQLRQIAHSTFLGLSNVPAIELSRELIRIAPKGLKRVFYSDSGSEAVEIALKIAFQYWQNRGGKKRKKFIRLTNAYHGDTLGSVSVGGIDLFHQMYRPLLFNTIPVSSPYRYRDSFKGSEADYLDYCTARLEAVLKRHANVTAALVMEPLMQGAAGMIDQPKGYISRARQLTKKYNTLLIFDEVATGFGRTGKWFACDHERVTPDIFCVAKGLSGGYLPLAATLTTENIYNAFLGDYTRFKTFFHGHTFTANPLACRAALANLTVFKKQKTLSKLQLKIKLLAQGLKQFENLRHVGDIRQKGLMAGIELVADRRTKKPFELNRRAGAAVTMRAREKGVIIRPLGNVVVLMPPLSITHQELNQLLKVVYQSIREVTE